MTPATQRESRSRSSSVASQDITEAHRPTRQKIAPPRTGSKQGSEGPSRSKIPDQFASDVVYKCVQLPVHTMIVLITREQSDSSLAFTLARPPRHINMSNRRNESPA
jgi:hypothetical protein